MVRGFPNCKFMSRWGWKLAVALSLALCVVAVWGWINSYRVGQAVQCDLPNAAPAILNLRGQSLIVIKSAAISPSLWVHFTAKVAMQPRSRVVLLKGIVCDRPGMKRVADTAVGPVLSRPVAVVSLDSGARLSDAGGFAMTVVRVPLIPGSRTNTVAGGYCAFHLVTIPDWALVIVCGLLPARACVASLLRRRAVRRGACPTCGYDLRATPDRCPECGTGVQLNS